MRTGLHLYTLYTNIDHEGLLSKCELMLDIVKCKYVIRIYKYKQNMQQGCMANKGNNKITELRTILQRESQNS